MISCDSIHIVSVVLWPCKGHFVCTTAIAIAWRNVAWRLCHDDDGSKWKWWKQNEKLVWNDKQLLIGKVRALWKIGESIRESEWNACVHWIMVRLGGWLSTFILLLLLLLHANCFFFFSLLIHIARLFFCCIFFVFVAPINWWIGEIDVMHYLPIHSICIWYQGQWINCQPCKSCVYLYAKKSEIFTTPLTTTTANT